MKLKKALAMAGLATVMTVGMSTAFAQGGPGGGGPGGGGFGGGPGGGGFGGGNFDPAQMRQQMVDNMRDTLKVTNDDEWKAISPKILAVMEARQAVPQGGRGMGMGMMGGRRGGNGGPDAAGGAGGRQGGPFGQQQSAALQALQQAIDANAPAAELKTKLDAYRAEIKDKQAALAKAQDDLKKLLSAQQEAIAVVNGLLN